MPLTSNLFAGSARLNACLVQDSAHVQPGDAGEHVADIQIALKHLDGLVIDPIELLSRRYGPSTAAAVLAYKKKRKIINHSYQSTEDNIVGKMTMASLEKEMKDRQTQPKILADVRCTHSNCACRE